MKTTAFASLTVLLMLSGFACSQSAEEILVPGRNATAITDLIVLYSFNGGAWVNAENTTHLGNLVYTVAVGDIDGDGVNEIVEGGLCPLTGCPNGNVKFLERNAQSEWAPYYADTNPTTVGSAVRNILAEDMDADGVDEVVACGSGSGNSIRVYDYQPDTGEFQRTVISNNSFPNDCVTSDMDGDGYKELFFQNSSSGPVMVYEYNGANYVKVHTIQPAEWDWPGKAQLTVIDDMASGDVNNDGIDDVLFCGNDAYPVVINYTSGDYKPIFISNYLLGDYRIDYIQSCDISDLNGDGYNDIILANKQIMYFEKTNKNDMEYAYKSTWNDTKQTLLYGMNVMCSGDADADSRNEMFVLSTNANKEFWAFQNDSAQTPYGPGFARSTISSKQATAKCVVADIDAVAPAQQLLCGDGYCDGATGENCNTCPGDCIGGTIQVGTCGACFKGVCDGICNQAKENYACSDCSVPVSYCCGDGVCGGIESQVSCAYDCHA